MSTEATIGVVLAVGSFSLALGGLILRAVFAHEAQPLRDGVLELKNAITNLSDLLRDEVVSRKEEQGEMRKILQSLQQIASDHETRLSLIEADAAPKVRRRS